MYSSEIKTLDDFRKAERETTAVLRGYAATLWKFDITTEEEAREMFSKISLRQERREVQLMRKQYRHLILGEDLG